MSKKTIIMLSIVILLVILFLYFRFHDPTIRTQRVFTLDKASIYTIEITSELGEVSFAKKDSTWYLVSEDYPANEEMIANLFESILNVNRSHKILTKDPLKHAEYQTTPETGTHIVFYDKKHIPIADFYLGFSHFYTFSSLRFAGENEVYELDSSIIGAVYPDHQQWRDPYIIRLNKDDITNIKVKSTFQDYQLKRIDKEWEYTSAEDTFTVYSSNRTLFKILNILQQLQSIQYLDNNEENQNKYKKDTIVKIEIVMKNGDVYNLIAYRYDEENCLLYTSRPTFLYVVNYDFTNRFTRALDNFKDYSNITY
ncbi:MAG TPA: DUF4340 domain-containing protein [Candidatus Cloacimonadota bacterium]|nr:DUF4340 domain-containing protein [Candidatus Cloacimonadota bacterium]